MVDITEISAIVAAAGVLIGVAYYVLDIRHQRSMRQAEIETRQANLFMQIYEHFYNEDFLNRLNEVTLVWNQKDFDDFWPTTDPEAFAKWDTVGTYFKGIGVLLKKKLIDLDLIEELVGTSIRAYWEKYSSLVEKLRTKWPHSMEGVEYLYNELKKREQAGVKSG